MPQHLLSLEILKRANWRLRRFPVLKRTLSGDWGRRRRFRIGPEQRSVGIHDLVGLGVEEIECVELDRPTVVERIARRPLKMLAGEERNALSSVRGAVPR
jgi:hypothetical protein